LKKYIKEIVIALILIFLSTSVIGYFRSASVKSNNLDLIKSATTIDGKKIKIDNKPLILTFWGTWCPVCSQEVYNLDTIAKKYNVITVAVNSGSNDDIKKYLKKKGVNFKVINDYNGKFAKIFNISVFPTTIYYSSSKNKIIKDSGYTTKAGMIARIKLVE